MNKTESLSWIEEIKWGDDGLIPAIAQEKDSGKLLCLAWMNREALLKTVEENRAVYWSRSRQSLWRKGEQSGHIQRLCEIRCDCDQDAILLIVEQVGDIACHTGRHSCFYMKLENEQWSSVEPVLKDPEAIYGK